MVWANASQRAAGNTPVQRQQPPPTSQTPFRASQNQPHPVQQPQPPHDDMFPSGAQFANRLDDFRNGGQGINSQLAAGSQPQTSNIDEFPPLGRNVAPELPQARRDSLMQNNGFGGYSSGMIGVSPKSYAKSKQKEGNQKLNARNSFFHAGIGASRSPVNQGPNGVLGQEKEVG